MNPSPHPSPSLSAHRGSARTAPVTADAAATPGVPPAPDVARAARGRYLRRHNARVIEQDDLLVVEFVDQAPWYTAAIPGAERERRARRFFSLALLGVGLSSSALTIAYLLDWI
jgi:hypothetical protein